MAAVCELVSGLDAELVRLGYKPSTLKWYRGSWRRLERWFASRGVQEFSLDVAMAWVDEACGGFFAKEQAGTLKQTDVYLFRVAAMLDDFAVHGAVLRRYSRTVRQADRRSGQTSWPGSRRRCGLSGCAVSTVRAYGTVAGEFLAFTGRPGWVGRVWMARWHRRVRGRRLAGYQAKTVEHKLCAVRSLLRFAAGDGLIDATVCWLTCPGGRSRPGRPGSRRYGTRPTWRRSWPRSTGATRAANGIYAIILLICQARAARHRRQTAAPGSIWTGLGNRLSVVQAKTGRRVQLPLLKDVGWAIIDYVRDGRPASECPEVFIRHTAPIGPFSDAGPSAPDPGQARPGQRTCRWVRTAAMGCTRCDTRSRPG